MLDINNFLEDAKFIVLYRGIQTVLTMKMKVLVGYTHQVLLGFFSILEDFSFSGNLVNNKERENYNKVEIRDYI